MVAICDINRQAPVHALLMPRRHVTDLVDAVGHLHFHLLGGREMGWPPG